jgi:hypothetical protein
MKKISVYLTGAALAVAAVFAFFALAFLPEKAEGVTIGEVKSFQLAWDGKGRRCQDLAADGTYLWVIDSDAHRGDVPEILKIYYDENAGSGTVEGSFNIPGTEYRYHKGLAWDGTYLLTAWGEYPAGRIYVIDPESPESATYMTLNFNLPYGLAYHYVEGEAGYLWTVANDTGYIYKLKRDNGSVVGTPFNTTPDIGAERKAAGLGFDGEYLWLAAFGKNDAILQYTTAGSLVESIVIEDLPGDIETPHPTGVTWEEDGDYLWYVDCCTDTFYRIKILFE